MSGRPSQDAREPQDTSRLRQMLPAPTLTHPLVQSQRLVAKRQITRHRARLNCEPCQRRKVKCDRLHPTCGKCAKTLRECVYNNSRSSQRPSHAALSVGTPKSGQGTIGEATYTANAKLKRASFDSPVPFDGATTAPGRERLPVTSSGLRPVRLDSSDESLSQHDLSKELKLHGNESGKIEVESQDAGREKCRCYPAIDNAQSSPTTDYADISKLWSGDVQGEFPDVEFALPSDGQDDDLFGELDLSHLNLQDESGMSFDQQPVSQIMSEMLEGFPSRSQCHFLFRCWFSGVQPFHPLLHPPTLLMIYQDFWTWFDQNGTFKPSFPYPQYIPLFFAIWYAGSASISSTALKMWFGDTTRVTLSARLYSQVTRTLTLVSFPQLGTLSTLAAFLTALTIRETEQDSLSTGLSLGVAVRVAQSMGLHRDPELLDLPAWELDTRRHIWWHIMQMDSALALATGLPNLVPDEDFWDTKSTIEVNEIELKSLKAAGKGTTVQDHIQAENSPLSLGSEDYDSIARDHYFASRGKQILSGATRKLTKIRMRTQRTTRQDMDEIRSILHNVELDVQEVVNSIAASGGAAMPIPLAEHNFSVDSPQGDIRSSMANEPLSTEVQPTIGDRLVTPTLRYHGESEASFYTWLETYFSLVVDKLYCVAYYPFLKSSKSELWPLARPSALRHAHSVMKKFHFLATDPQFQPYQWKRPGTHLPKHSSVILLIDLYERPKSKEAPVSRALVDNIFALSGRDGVMLRIAEENTTAAAPQRDGGREEWNMLIRLRERAWQKAGLNHHVLWSGEVKTQSGTLEASPTHSRSARTTTPRRALKKSKTEGKFHSPSSFQLPQQSQSAMQEVLLQESNTLAFTDHAGIDSGSLEKYPSSILESQPFQTVAMARCIDPQVGLTPPLPPVPPVTNTNVFEDAVDTFDGSQGALTESFGTYSCLPAYQELQAQFDWNEWDAVFGQAVPLDVSIAGMDWEGTNS